MIKKTSSSLGSVFKCFLIFVVFIQLSVITVFFVGGEALSNRYVLIDKTSITKAADKYLFHISDVELVNRDIYLKVLGASKDLRIGRKDRGEVNTKVMCEGNAIQQQVIRLNGDYALSRDSIYLPLIKNVSGHKCQVEVILDSKEFAQLVDSMSVVRSGQGVFMGFDLRVFPMLLKIVEAWYFFSVWYLSFFHGLPMIAGIGVTLITLFLYKYFKRDNPL